MAFDTRPLRAGVLGWFILVVLLLTAVLATCAVADGDYRLGAGDQLTIVMWGVENDPLANVELQVRSDGKIAYPLVGEVDVTGKSPAELATTLENGVKAMYKNPKITVMVRKSASNVFYVLGEVRGAGGFEWNPGMNIKEALAKANGLTDVADSREAVLTRKDGTKITVDLEDILKKGNSEKEVAIQPGDSLLIKSAMVAILGAVQNPVNFPIREGNTLSALLARAGGPTDKADLMNSYITRGGQKVSVNLRSLLIDKDPAADVALLPGDVVNVPISRARIGVFGSIMKPGTYDLVLGDKDHLFDALAMAGGPIAAEARMDRVKIIRMQPDGSKKEIWVNASKGGQDANIQLVQGDYIEVQKKKPPMTISQFASLALSIFYIVRGLSGN